MNLRAGRDDRVACSAAGATPAARSGWALCSLLFHGTALAAVLIAAAGEGPQLPPAAIEVSVVVASAPAGAAPSAARTMPDARREEPVLEPVEPEPAPAEERASVDDSPPAAAEPGPAEPEERPLPVAELAPAPERAPPPPARKPAPPQAMPVQPERSASDAPPQPSVPSAAPPAQLAALPDAQAVDSAATPGAGVSEPRYEAGGEANPWPRYPAAARRRGIEGEVLVRVAVGLDGRAERVEVLRSSGSGLLDEAAVEALERWRFEPARAAGQPVAATVDIPVTFRLTDPEGS